MKAQALLLTCLLLPAMAHAEVGIGGSIRSGESDIYLPIDLGSLRIEPFIGWTRYHSENGFGGYTSEYRDFGVGVFGHGTLSDNIQLIGGARAVYVRYAGFGDQTGYRIEPTLGAEYFLTPRFSVALENFYSYQKLKGDVQISPGVSQSSETETQGTASRIIARLMF